MTLFAAFPDFELRDPRPDDLPEPHGGPLARAGDIRRPGDVPGVRAQRRSARSRGLRRRHRRRRQDPAQRRLRRQRRDRPSARFLPPAGSRGEARLDGARQPPYQARGLAARQSRRSPIADGVWVVRGGFPIKTMNVYLLADNGGVTVFDCGISAMTPAVAAAARGSAGSSASCSGTRTPTIAVLRPDWTRRSTATRPSARRPSRLESFRPYWDFGQAPPVRPGVLQARCCRPGTVARWRSPGTVERGRRGRGIRGRRPARATRPGLIGLFRDSDGLALVSDCIYTLDPQTGIKGAAADSARGVRRRHRAGPRLDPQAGRARSLGRLGRATPIR